VSIGEELFRAGWRSKQAAACQTDARKVPRRVIDPRPDIRHGDEELGTRRNLHRHSLQKDEDARARQEAARALKKIVPEAEK
jgi:hypothetical protein